MEASLRGRMRRGELVVLAWEPLVVCGGRELPIDEPQAIMDALVARRRIACGPWLSLSRGGSPVTRVRRTTPSSP